MIAFISLTNYHCDDILRAIQGENEKEKQLEQTYQGEISEIELPEKSIMTVVFDL